MSSTVIQANQRSSEPTSGHPSQSQRSSKPINGHPSGSMVIRANQRSSEAINGHRWQLISIRGSQWPSMAISELAHLRAVRIRYSSEVIRGHQRPSEFIRARAPPRATRERRRDAISPTGPPDEPLATRGAATTGVRACCRSGGTIRQRGRRAVVPSQRRARLPLVSSPQTGVCGEGVRAAGRSAWRGPRR